MMARKLTAKLAATRENQAPRHCRAYCNVFGMRKNIKKLLFVII
jgi:hypothetical protein